MGEDRRRNLRDVLDELDKYFEDFEKEMEEVVRNSVGIAKGHTGPFVAGFSFKLGPEGRPSVQFFGDTKSDGYRSPLAEQILDQEKGLLRLVLDMPGVEKEDISLDATEEKAMVTAEREGRKYKAEITLKARVMAESGKAEYKNGVLEILFSLKDKDNKGYKRLDIV
ncbi:MAG: Hsp20/alpha crystallin family protein [archaeon]|nr:MAG: Hsp20/alpha crystallin family protein [archaeon]